MPGGPPTRERAEPVDRRALVVADPGDPEAGPADPARVRRVLRDPRVASLVGGPRRRASPSPAGLVTTVLLGFTVLVHFLVPTVERRIGTGRTLAIGLLALGAPSPMYL